MLKNIAPVWCFGIQTGGDSINPLVFAQLKQQGIRVELHGDNRTIAKKIRELSERKIPLIAIVGEREAAHQMLNVRRLGRADPEEVSLAQLEQELLHYKDFNSISSDMALHA